MPKKKRDFKKINRRKIFASIFIFAGLFLFIIASFQKLKNKFSFWEKPTSSISPSYYYSPPKTISIPKIGIKNLPIIEGGIINKQWILDDKSALFLPSSGKPGEGFNTIIYAHNRPGLFFNLQKLEKDDQIIISNEKNQEFVYHVFSKEISSPSELTNLKSEIPNTLTLFTCEGFFDQKRLIVKAKLIKSSL